MFDSFELNKIAGSVLASVLVLFLIGTLGGVFVHTDHVEKQAYVPEGTEAFEAGGAGGGDVAAAPAAEESSVPLIATASVEGGAKVFKKCGACHSVNAADGNGTGPNLAGIVGRGQASAAGFGYSDALAGLGGSWGYDELDHFLRKPKEYAPGTKMAFAGLKKASDRADVIAYLRAASPNAPALPEAAPIVEEVMDAVEAASDAAAEEMMPAAE